MVLDPKSSVVLVIESTSTHARADGQAAAPQQRVVDAAAIVAAPVLVARHPDASPGPSAGKRLAYMSDPPSFVLDAVTPNWSTTSLGVAVAATGRNQLIVAGQWLEDAVTLIVLRSLSVGYDTYVPLDATPAHDPALAAIAHTRLVQAGVVPTSSAQIVREWAALSEARDTSDALLALLS